MGKVFLDPGHGARDSGAVNGDLKEKDIVLDIAKQTRDILVSEYDNVEVMLSRESDVFLSLSERAAKANQWGADYFCSVHVNAGGGTGFESFIHTSQSSGSIKAQEIVHSAIMDEIDVRDRGRKVANFAVLRLTRMPAILTENLFIDNNDDVNLLKDSKFITKIARGHAEGIANALKLKKKSGGSSSSKSNTPKTSAKNKNTSSTNKGSQSRSKATSTSAYDLIRQYFPNVAALQRQLIAVGENLSRFRDDGVPGEETLQAIKSFQRKEGITVDGIPGPVTQSRLRSKIKYTRLLRLLSPMMRGEDIRQVQRVLNIKADSIFGPQTERAVREFQRKHSLKVDGIVGRQTWGAMF